MKSTGKIIYEIRTKKGITQEELANLAKVNLKTIQRIESELTEPRDTTISLICAVLQIDQDELKPQPVNQVPVNFAQVLINAVFLVILNTSIAAISIYLTVYDTANIYTKIGAFLLCTSLPYFIVSSTSSIKGARRLLKFGFAFILPIVFALFQISVKAAVVSGLIPFALVGLAILFYGNTLKMNFKN